jgi:hypothetical protein
MFVYYAEDNIHGKVNFVLLIKRKYYIINVNKPFTMY